MRIGALCAGMGGLEMGLASVTDVDLAWYAEYDAAPSAIMAHHHPGVTNLHDVTAIDWSSLEPVDVLTAGYPCQPFSAAGMRRGEDDPRHLWPHIAEGIAILRPPLCVFENVRGHLSLGFDKVLLDLHRLGYDVRWYLLRAADVGAAHGRARLFIFASDRSTVPAADLPAGAPVAVAGVDGWLAPESGLFGVDPFAGKLPPCGRMVEGHLYATPAWLARPETFPLLATPVASEGTKPSNTMGVARRESTGQVFLTNQIVSLCGLDPSEVTLLPTPAVNDMGEGKDVDAWDAWDAWTERMRAAHGNGNGHGKSLAIEAQRMLLPTPTTSDTNGAGAHGSGGPDLRTVVGSLLPTPRATRGGSHTETRDALLPTPRATDGTNGGPNQRGSSGDLMLPSAVHQLLPTPRTRNNENRQSERFDPNQTTNFHGLLTGAVSWGDYAPAIARWETVIGRPAPSPTEPGAKGGHRLAPRFVEWLMGLPEGWVCDVPGLTRNNQLKALGNGVVPQQCAAAYRAFLADEMRATA